MNIDEEVILLVKRLAKTIKKVGVKKVVAALDDLNSEEGFIEVHKEIINLIITKTSLKFQVDSDDLKRKNIRGSLVDARSMCFVLLKKHLELKHNDIASLFGCRNHSLVSKALSDFNDLDYNVKTDRKFIDIFREIDKIVEEKKNILWLKHS